MKHTLIVLALMAAFSAQAQESTSQSGSQSGSTSNSGAGAVAVGNTNDATAQSQSGSQSGATASTQSGALGNVVVIDQSGPTSQTVNANSTSTYNGKIENIQSGTSTNNTNVHYSGTQTLKNVPGIAMSGPASGPCTGASGGLGLAGPGWGLGLNGAKVEPSCVVRENVRVIGMAMQSLDGNAYPQEKGELMLLMMDAVRGLGAMNSAIIGEHVKAPK
jgi:hypothetical protein